MKLKILFITNSLGLGGSERCMQEMINRMDESKYDIDVLSLTESKSYITLNKNVNIINGYSLFKNVSSSTKILFAKYLKKFRFDLIFKRLYYVSMCRLFAEKVHGSKFFWQSFSRDIPIIKKEYDVVIGYGQSFPTYMLKDKVVTKKKIAWLNTDLIKAHYDIKFIKKFYESADYIITDSNNGKKLIAEIYPEMDSKTYVFLNILDVNGILEKSQTQKNVYEENGLIKILSIGRLTEAKAFHLAVEAALILKQKKLPFKWYIIGDGNLRSALDKQIKDCNLQNEVILLGKKTNPYPYIRECDIYAQTSVFEGSCMTVSEAMIFNKPIVSTDFPAIFEKITDGTNGLICKMNAEDIAEKIEILFENSHLKEKFSDYLKNNQFDYEKQMDLLDKIINK